MRYGRNVRWALCARCRGDACSSINHDCCEPDPPPPRNIQHDVLNVGDAFQVIVSLDNDKESSSTHAGGPNFAKSLTSDTPGLATLMPEPASLCVLGMAAVSLLSRRRR